MPEQPPTTVNEPSPANGLGHFLKELRNAKGFTLRDVEDATRNHEEVNVVSNAYVSQLENGKITDPSPHILHSLAVVYGVPYEALMQRAGYFMPQEGKRLGTFAEFELSTEEEDELVAYLRFRRDQGKSGG